MDNTQLLSLLRSHGVHCQLRPDVEYFTQLTEELGQVICMESPTQAGHAASGISFWLHAGAGFAFLGLWTGVTYQLARPTEIAKLATELLGGRYSRSGVTPYRISEKCIDEYGLEECEALEMWPETSLDRLQDVQNAGLKWAISPTRMLHTLRCDVDSCGLLPDGLVDLRLGVARVLVRFGGSTTATRASLGALVYPELCATSDHVTLLGLMARRLGCDLYDPGWGNRIHFDDRYYMAGDNELRPDSPYNVSDEDLE